MNKIIILIIGTLLSTVFLDSCCTEEYFYKWTEYTNRVCHMLTGGTHIAPVAVLYHAEAEWGGKYQPFEKVVKLLLQNQIDCDIIPIDTLTDKNAISG
jgi:hypothetical protein